MSNRRLAIIVICVIVTGAHGAYAQQDQGTIAGRVTDATGASVPGAVVTASSFNDITIRTRSNREGHYVLGPLAIGLYVVAIEAASFRRARTEPIRVHANARVRLDVQLELGSFADSIVVRPEAPLLQTDTSSLTTVLGADQIIELPTNGRNFQQLAMLSAGVLPAFGNTDREAGFNSHGQWAIQNNFILDGVDNNSHIMGLQDRKAQVLIPNLDAVQEFQIHTSNYSAEFGRHSGAVMNVSLKSGTNKVRGTAHEFFRNDIFDARDTFDYDDRTGDGKADPDVNRRNQYGFTVGGPIRKSRTFYFGSLEVTNIRSTENRLVTVPTRTERLGVFNSSVVDPQTGLRFSENVIPSNRWDPVAAQLLRLWPDPNFVGTTRANYVSSPRSVSDRYQYDIRVDHTWSVRDRMFARASRMDFDAEREGPLPAPAVGAPNNDTAIHKNGGVSVAFSETHVFGSGVVHEVRFGYNRLRTNKRPLVRGFPNEDFGLHVRTSEAVEGLARLTFVGPAYVALGESTFNPNDKTSRTFQLLDNLSIAMGKHAVRAGLDLRWLQSSITGAAQSRGIFSFSGEFTESSFGDFLLGMPISRSLTTFQRADLRERVCMFYVQDDWRVGRRLTLNLGIRYELVSPMFDASDRMTSLDDSVFPNVRVLHAGARGRSWSDRALVRTDTNNWAPRIGVAYQPAPRWTIRAADGIFYGVTRAVSADLRLVNNWPHFREVFVDSTVTPGRLSDGIDDSLLGSANEMPTGLSWNVWSTHFPLPAVHQWNVSVQRQFGQTWVATGAYVGSLSKNLPRQYDINAADPGDRNTLSERRLIPSLGAITYVEPSGRATYRALEGTLEKRFSRGWQGTIAYTWSRSIDDVTELFGAEGPTLQDKRNFAGDRGNSGFDRRHRLVAHGIVDLPFGADRRWLRNPSLARTLLADWRVSGIMSMQSGAYFDVTVVDRTNRLGGGSGVWRPDLVGNPGVEHPGPDRWINEAAFAIPQNPDGTFRYGNLRRNSLTGPAYFNLDAGLMRNVRLGSTRVLQLRWEVFNMTNHPSYGLPNTLLGSADFGTIRTTVSSPRQMQFGLKLMF